MSSPPSEPRSKQEIIKAIDNLTQEQGFLYSLALILRHDFFFDIDEAADVDWKERLSFQEVSLLVGLMVKHAIDTSYAPTQESSKQHISAVYQLFNELHWAHQQPFIERIKKTIEETKSAKKIEPDTKEFFSNGEMLTEPIFYDGSGAYDFQCIELSKKKYQEDTEWIQSHLGIPLAIITEIAPCLKILHSEHFHIKQSDLPFEEFAKSCLSIFCFSYEDLNKFPKQLVERFINTFSVTPGTVNQNLGSVGSHNSIDSHPIVVLGDNLFFLPIYFQLAQSIYESPFYWMNADKSYTDAASKHRGDATVRIASNILMSVFGPSNVHTDVKVVRDKKHILSDIDILAIAGNKAIIVQAKSKRLTELSKSGNTEQLKADFKKAIQEAYEQGLSCRKAVIDKTNALIKKDGVELHLGEYIDEAYIICLTLDNYPALTHQTTFLLEINDKDPYPITMNIFDLDIIATYLNDPFEFLYYVRQRIATYDHFKADSEICYLEFHLMNKLYIDKKYNLESLYGYGQVLDADFPALRGYQPHSKASERLRPKWQNKQFQQLIEAVKNTEQPYFTDAIFFLYDIAGKAADDLINLIQKQKQRSLHDRQPHDFSAPFENGKYGITFLSLPDYAEQLPNRLLRLAKARKYKTKADMWLGMGVMADSKNIVDIIAFNKQPWVEDQELDQLSKRIFTRTGKAVFPNGEKVGRNSRCPCGSGAKFKKCCGK